MAFIFYLTHIHIGNDSLAQLQSECERIGIHRPLVVSDKGVAAAGIVERVTESLPIFLSRYLMKRPQTPLKRWRAKRLRCTLLKTAMA
jgi:alcohol dehydrogenase class IV